MRIQVTRHIIAGQFAGLVLLALFLVQPRVHAQEEVTFVFNTISWGMVRGQTARFSVFNPNEQSERERPPVVWVQVRLFDASGFVIETSDEIAVPPGEFRSVDFNRDDLPLAEERGGRLQTRAQVRYRSFSIVDRSQMSVWPTSIELIDGDGGRSALLLSQKPKEIVVVGSTPPAIPRPPASTELPVIVYASRGLIGLTYGQTLRVSALYSQRQSARAFRARVSVYDSNGALLSQSAVATISQSEFHSFDFDRAVIPASGGRAGGRLQLRVSLEVAAIDPTSVTQDPGEPGPLTTSLELVDNNTGRTTAVWVTTGFFEVLPPRPTQ